MEKDDFAVRRRVRRNNAPLLLYAAAVIAELSCIPLPRRLCTTPSKRVVLVIRETAQGSLLDPKSSRDPGGESPLIRAELLLSGCDSHPNTFVAVAIACLEFHGDRLVRCWLALMLWRLFCITSSRTGVVRNFIFSYLRFLTRKWAYCCRRQPWFILLDGNSGWCLLQ